MESLRRLKEQSGLSFRRLEERAAAVGDVLPRSTVAAMLSNGVPPRKEVLVAFVRACGDGCREVEWLAACDRAAARPRPVPQRTRSAEEEGAEAEAGSGGGAAEPDRDGAAITTRGESGRRDRGRFTAVVLGVVILAASTAAATTTTLFRAGDDGERRPGAAAVSSGPAPSMPRGWVTIRPADDPGLCLTDGRVRDWRHTPLVAVQRPCDEAAPQSTMLELVSENLYRVQWHHPDYGKGCLKALTSGTGAGLLEPWDACQEASLFRVEPSGPLAEGRFVLRVEGGGCVGIKDSSSVVGAEAVLQTCNGKGRQVFLIRPAQ
ncbi:RICIN domain-containing protein [Streptomyces sp. M41]|uniref:RICIN domain-containing protein n=1 Tax=Streptomyces sp. M41 TaxID=3059412 RepID=UPI00374CC2D7